MLTEVHYTHSICMEKRKITNNVFFHYKSILISVQGFFHLSVSENDLIDSD